MGKTVKNVCGGGVFAIIISIPYSALLRTSCMLAQNAVVLLVRYVKIRRLLLHIKVIVAKMLHK